MSNWIETKLEDLANKMDKQLEARDVVDKDLLDEFAMYYKLYQEKQANLRRSASSEEDSTVQSAPSSKDH